MFKIGTRLYLGDVIDSQNTAAHTNHGLTTIINCTADLPFTSHAVHTMQRMRVPVDDNLQGDQIRNMGRMLPKIVAYLDRALRSGQTVLVHCYAGRQRSACVIAAFLMFKKGYTVDEAVHIVRSIKPDAFWPGVNFLDALLKYEDTLAAGRRRSSKK